MAVNNTITLGWKGKEYTIQPTMRHIDFIEEHLSIYDLRKRCGEGKIPFSHLCKLIALLLQLAGAKDATQEAIYFAMNDEGSEYDPVDLVNVAMPIIETLFPQPKAKKPTPKAKRTKK